MFVHPPEILTLNSRKSTKINSLPRFSAETPSNSSAGDPKKMTHISTPTSSPSSVGFQFDADGVGREQRKHELRLDLRGLGRMDQSEEGPYRDLTRCRGPFSGPWRGGA